MRYIYTFLFLLVSLSVFPQVYTIKGNVSDSHGEPLTGATIAILRTNRFTEANLNGDFSLDVKPGEVIAVNYTGFIPQEIKINNQKKLNIVLKERKETQLADILCIGYSRQERRDITGSVSTIKPKEQKAMMTLDQMLAGQAPGVYFGASSGALGSANILTIRGISSIMGDNNPLYVIDGVPIYSTDRESNTSSTTGGAIKAVSMGGMQIGGGSLQYNTDLNNSFEKNPLASLNIDDIESIEILKDAYATAIYGSRGAAGVILITTKKGKRDRNNININYSIAIDQPIGKLDLLNGSEYNLIYSLFYPNTPFTAPYNTDWIDAVTRTAVSQNVSASVSGGSDKINYFISASYGKNEAYIINNDMSKYSARANLDSKINDFVTVGMNVSLSNLDNNALQSSQIYSMAVKKSPNLPIYNDDGSDYHYGYKPNPIGTNDAYNPVAFAYNDLQNITDTRMIGNIYFELDPWSWLTWRTEVGSDMYNSQTYVKKKALPDEVSDVPSDQATESTSMNNRIVINNTANFRKTFNYHHFTGIVGQSYEKSKEHRTSVAGNSFFSPDLVGVGAAQSKRVTYSGEQAWALFSAFARINYQYKHKYMGGVTYRIDGSSKYNKDHRYLNTPSVSLGWRFSEEPIIRNNVSWIDDAKLRGSIGWSSKNGNNSYYGAQAIYTINTGTSYGDYTYLQMSQPANSNLDWEKTVTYDVGLDASLLNDRLNLTVDYYYKRTNNMLFSSDLPAYTGYSKQDQNIADMQNQGIEVSLTSYNIRRKDFTWMTILNMSHNSNKILKLNFEGNQLDQANSSFKYYEVGGPVAQWYLHEWGGVNPENGNPVWILADGTKTEVPPASNYATSAANKKVYGTALPKFYGSLTNSFEYKGIELNFMFTFSCGGRMINATKATLYTYTTADANNLHKDLLNAWQMYGQKTDMPKLKNSSVIGNYDYTTAVTSSRFLEKSDYLRLRNLEVAYRVPQNKLRKLKVFNNIRASVIMTNLFTITSYSGVDPDVSAFGSSALASGYDYLTMPQTKSYQMSLLLGF